MASGDVDKWTCGGMKTLDMDM
jgi:hypothetical protein